MKESFCSNGQCPDVDLEAKNQSKRETGKAGAVLTTFGKKLSQLLLAKIEDAL